MSEKVLVLSIDCKPLMPLRSARANRLLKGGKAAIYQQKPEIIYSNLKISHRYEFHTAHLVKLIQPKANMQGLIFEGLLA